MKKILKLTVTISTSDGDPGHPTRFTEVFKRIGGLLGDGATAGEFEQDYRYSQGGESNLDRATVAWYVAREEATR